MPGFPRIGGVAVSKSTLGGFFAAGLTVLIWASYPVVTRAGLRAAVLPDDLLLMRFGIGMLFFLPYLLLKRREFTVDVWRRGIPLALCQGAGMAALVIFGLQFVPASHAAALGPGVSPAWVAVLGFLLFSQRPTARHAVGACVTFAGVIVLASASGVAWSESVLLGDSMILVASALGALYVLQLRFSAMDPWQGATIVAVYSGLVVVPWYLLASDGSLAGLLAPGMLWHIVWQGVLIGFVSLVAMNHAITRLGSERASAAFAVVPPLSALLAYLFLGEVPSQRELFAVLAISAGVVIAVSRPRFRATAPSTGALAGAREAQAGSPAVRRAAA